jgi:hypothetical protein
LGGDGKSVSESTAPPDSPAEFIEVYLPEVARSVPLPATSSIGSLTLRVLDAGEWSLRVDAGALSVTRCQEDDVVVQLTVPSADFGPLIVEGARRAEDPARAGRGLLRALSLDAETARLIRHVPGSILLEARAGDRSHRLLFTPGRRTATLQSPECTIRCSLDDLVAVQTGMARGLDLFTSGRLQLSGNVQIALALSGLFL